ncbi:alanine--tRNA ligase, mitochondrial isoform X2 [Armigeres subalbatus]
MGNSGPCGPCTEIHIDHSDKFIDTANRKHLVNAGVPDLTEVWNIVFIQYNRNADNGQISDLPQRHVDTGLGLERLVAHLQQKNSNYDTDLFIPIFDRIQKVSKKDGYRGIYDTSDSRYPLDTAYRVVADHTRMITACLSDGMFPSQNHKLRRLLRRSLSLSDRIFSSPTLLQELVPVVVEILGDTYPEMHKNLQKTQQIIKHEEQCYKQLCSNLSSESRTLLKEYSYFDAAEVTDHPGLPYALKEIKRLKANQGLRLMDGEVIHKMYDTYGLDEELLIKIAEFEQLDLDLQGYNVFSKRMKEGAKIELAARLQASLDASQGLTRDLDRSQVRLTRNEFKYNYAYNEDKHLYEIPKLKTKITSIVTSETDPLCHVITEKSNFYFESGGQQSDRGSMSLATDPSTQIQVKAVGEHLGFVIHSVDRATAQSLAVGDEVILSIDPHVRSSNIVHHTATHLLNAAARNVLAVPMCQRSSFVGNKALKLELAVCGAKIGPEEVDAMEQQIRQNIRQNESVRVRVCNAADLEFDKITMIPGEVYPEKGLRLVEIGQSTSSEFCCGTHAQWTGELQDFCITNVSQNKSGCYTFLAIAGQPAVKAHQLGIQIQNDVNQLKHDMDQKLDNDTAGIDARMQRLKNVLLVGSENNINLPYAVRQRCLEVINDLCRQLKDHTRESLRELFEMEMKNLQQVYPLASTPFIVHFLESSLILEEIQLSKATRYFKDRPILIISITDDQVKARATVPATCINERFDAQKWLKTVGAVFKSGTAPPKGQNPMAVCNMKSRKVKALQFETLLERALKEASEFARLNMQ